MAYFSKDAYFRKRAYADRKSSEGIEKIAIYLLSENPEYAGLDVDDPKDYAMLEQGIEELSDELKPIADLSHRRHEIHSTNRSRFVGGDIDILTETGNEWSDGSLIDNVNALNRKYGLVDGKIPLIGDVPVTFDDTIADILDYYGEEPSGDDTTFYIPRFDNAGSLEKLDMMLKALYLGIGARRPAERWDEFAKRVNREWRKRARTAKSENRCSMQKTIEAFKKVQKCRSRRPSR